MKNNFKIRICSDLDYEEMVADICFENITVAIISQDKGEDSMEIDIFPYGNIDPRKRFLVDDFVEAIIESRITLINMKKKSD